MQTITRDEAQAKGLKRFFTGRPCDKKGHLSERYVTNGGCIECLHRRPVEPEAGYEVVAAPAPYKLPKGTKVTVELLDLLHSKVQALLPSLVKELKAEPGIALAIDKLDTESERIMDELEKTMPELTYGELPDVSMDFDYFLGAVRKMQVLKDNKIPADMFRDYLKRIPERLALASLPRVDEDRILSDFRSAHSHPVPTKQVLREQLKHVRKVMLQRKWKSIDKAMQAAARDSEEE